ncbi:4-hydroxybenzoate octaprenyltransferase [Simiduia sp. 21SJ11W-1]|nr:4-hydroxybenzoate octaprenyltransferase [Simiduia sp. 21SJ11W-1]UTA49692.1 4-hydroxybenzoate octaprenyltransferase [Simiduia sp. 21SJ11W-1]
MRFDRPVGTLLLLWPTLWALWLAADGLPPQLELTVFVLGVILMRAAGCVINDYADRKVDGHVARTKARPIVSGAVTPRAALITFALLVLLAFALVLLTNTLTIALSVGGLLLAAIYPFMKRHTYLPQVVLGAAFAWAIPMAFAAVSGSLEPGIWLIYTAVVLWTVAYDTYYAMVDRPDDLRIGVKSTAILFGESDLSIIFGLQILALVALALAGARFELGQFYYLGLVGAAALFVWQQWVARRRDPKGCFQAFLNNQWVGAVIFAGIVADTGF